MDDQIVIRGAHLHNLKNVSLSIPKNKLVVFTGVSGSGKSTLAFDTLHREGQRQYLESLGLVTFGVSRPAVESIRGLSPSISVDQNLANHSPRSTVGTVTEVYTYLRVLYARIGHRPCQACGAEVGPAYDVEAAASWPDDADEEDARSYPCPHCGAPVPELGMAHFSFNKPAGACPTCTGLGVVHRPDLGLLLDGERSILEGSVRQWSRYEVARHAETLRKGAAHYGFAFDPAAPIGTLGPLQRELLLHGTGSPQLRGRFAGVAPPRTLAQGRFEGVVPTFLRRYDEHIHNPGYREKMARLLVVQTCPDCGGDRIRPEGRQVTVLGETIVELSRRPLTELAGWLERLSAAVSGVERRVSEPLIADLSERVRRLIDVGAGYLNLARSSPTLSAGEAQRLRLAALLGSGLTGVLYVLDEPTIGVHARDTARMIGVLRQLRDLGNTVLVVEHDLDVVRAADYVVDIGPGAGEKGGEVVVAGPPAAVAACPASVTGQYLSGRASSFIPARRAGNGGRLVIRGAREHNLKNITVSLPLGALVAVTGVSGSGKSTLLGDVLERAARQHFHGAGDPPGAHDGIEGWEHLDQFIAIDQTPLSRTPRSNAATYTGAYAAIRDTFAATPEARQRGLQGRHFSFNVPGGRCERCEGTGKLAVEMHFLPDVEVRCPACRGRRFKREVLTVPYRGRSIADVLDMTIDEAHALFQDVPAIAARLGLMVDVGLGYLQLGQPVTALSGGEAQRIKLAKELARRATGRTLYLLDEPTTGLHPTDVARLLAILQRLVSAGNSVLVIEHNLDVVKVADWVVDLGPEGGDAGGHVVAEGTPEQVAWVTTSHTGALLRPLLGMGGPLGSG